MFSCCVRQGKYNLGLGNWEPFLDPHGDTWNSYPFQPQIQVKILLWNAVITYPSRPFDLSWPTFQVDMAILDFSKALDTVPHEHLLGKMEFYGIQGPLLKWTASFLKTRSQSVLVEEKYSKLAKVLSGVLQGTFLGPLLFWWHSQCWHFPGETFCWRLSHMYRPVHSLANQLALQADLLALECWGNA